MLSESAYFSSAMHCSMRRRFVGCFFSPGKCTDQVKVKVLAVVVHCTAANAEDECAVKAGLLCSSCKFKKRNAAMHNASESDCCTH